MDVRRVRQLSLVALLLGAFSQRAAANGRMPGANDVVFDPGDPAHLLLRATFGVMQSFDGGESWQWICEQVVGTSGVIADPPLALLEDGSVVLLPPTGGALLSRDAGCSWSDAPAPLAEQRGVDLTLDPNDPAHLLVLTSTLDSLNGDGIGSYRNLLIETGDSGATWQLLATLPADFEAETVEIAASDPARIYVSGTASDNPRRGIVQRSEDGGGSWTHGALELPAGTGSLLISGIHPERPDWLWLRVPARGDTIGVLPARLYLSEDKGQSFRLLASTRHGMFGFALSPDGAELAYGGPSDGLYLGPADGSGAFRKLSSAGVRCLRWPAEGALYVCGTEPADDFSLAVSQDQGASLRKLYALAETCPALCDEATSSAAVCQEAWQIARPLLGASGAMCAAPWAAAPGPDAGIVEDAGAAPDAAGSDAASPSADGSDAASAPHTADQAPANGGTGCACGLAGAPRTHTDSEPLAALGLAAVLIGYLYRRPARGGDPMNTQATNRRRPSSDQPARAPRGGDR